MKTIFCKNFMVLFIYLLFIFFSDLCAIQNKPFCVNSNSSICAIQSVQAADIKITEEAITPGGKLPITLIPKANLSNIAASFSEQGKSSSSSQKIEIELVKSNESFIVQLDVPEELKRSGDVLPRFNEDTGKIESKTFLLEIRGILSDGQQAYSGEIIVFDNIKDGSYQALKLADYFKKYDYEPGSLDVLPESVINTANGIPSQAEPVDSYDKVMDKYGNVERLLENTKLAKNNSIQSTVTVQVSGNIYFQDSDGNSHPLSDVTVEVYEVDDGVGYHQSGWTAITNSNGYYSISVTDDESDSNLEIYLCVKTINSMLSVETIQGTGEGLAVQGDYPYTWIGPTNEGITSGSTTLNYSISNSTKGAAQLFAWLMQACYFTRTSFDPGAAQATWSASATGVDPNYNNNLLFQSIYANVNSHDVAYHEYGHLTMYRRNGYHAPGSGGIHNLFASQVPGLAWSEGWATAYAQFINNDGYYDAANFYPLRIPIENNSEMTQLGIPEVYYELGQLQDNEIRAAAAILDFYDTGESGGGDDPANNIISFNEMMTIIANNNIVSTIDFYNKMLSYGYLTVAEKDYAYRVMLTNTFDVPFIGGTITSNRTWSENLTLSQNVTVQSGVTLTIAPGVQIRCEPGISFIINGILDVNGTISDTVFFSCTDIGVYPPPPGTWGSIQFDGSSASASNIDYLGIYYDTGIRCLNGANPVIQNCYIYQCTNGVYIYNSAPQIIANKIDKPQQNGIYGQASGMSPLIKDNTVISVNPIWYGYRGIWFYSGTIPFVTHNDVSGFADGSAFGGNVTAYFSNASYVTPYRNNRFRNNGNGISADNNCYIMAGTDYGSYCENSSYNNTYYDVSSTNNSDVFAQLNYWGGGQAVTQQDGTSTLYITPIRTSDPWSGIPKILAETQNNSDEQSYNGVNFTVADSSFSDLYTGIILQKDGKIDEAIAHYKNMIQKGSYADFALTSLFSLKNKYSKDEVMTYLASFPISDKNYALTSKLIADNAIQNNRFDEAIGIYDILIKNYLQEYEGINARFDKLFAYINVKNDKGKAEEVLACVKALNLKDDEWLARIQVAEELIGTTVSQKKENGSNIANNDLNNSQEYTVLNNYPNPFNPSTVISFSIPNSRKVTLKVYDVLGREVAVLVNEEKPAGFYTVNFNGDNLASGIYIYSLITNEKIMTKKMLLVK
jgi:tetratricopeptide (TPR) repeat protein